MLAGLLRQRLQPYATGNKEAFSKAVRTEADELARLPFGIAMLHCIGCGLACCDLLEGSQLLVHTKLSGVVCTICCPRSASSPYS